MPDILGEEEGEMKRKTPYWPSLHGPKVGQLDQELSTELPTAENCLRYISAYPEDLRERIRGMIRDERLGAYLLERYPVPHEHNSNKLLRAYTNQIKTSYLKSSERLSKVCFDDKLHLVHHALGTQTFVSLAHGGRLKARRELRVSSLFKRCPEPLLRMIVVHELAHLKEKEHNQAFYRLCIHMEERYHQLEFEARLYLIYCELSGSLY